LSGKLLLIIKHSNRAGAILSGAPNWTGDFILPTIKDIRIHCPSGTASLIIETGSDLKLI